MDHAGLAAQNEHKYALQSWYYQRDLYFINCMEESFQAHVLSSDFLRQITPCFTITLCTKKVSIYSFQVFQKFQLAPMQLLHIMPLLI